MPLEEQQPVADSLQIGGAIGLGAILMAWLGSTLPKMLNWFGERINRKVLEAEKEQAKRQEQNDAMLEELRKSRELLMVQQSDKIDMLMKQINKLEARNEENEQKIESLQVANQRLKESNQEMQGKIQILEQNYNPGNLAALIAKEMNTYNLPFKHPS